tara:strand:- start:845 stop:1678 length:834 start_codon:yes stop_codon:yes gene_type:complete
MQEIFCYKMHNWRKYNGTLISALPPHVDIENSEQSILKYIKMEDAFFARWISDFDSKNETCFWYVICDKKMSIEDYSKNTRSKIRRGLKNCNVKLISKNEIINNGYLCYSEAFKNYNSYLPSKSFDEFKNALLSLKGDWHFWGIYKGKELIGYSQNLVIGDFCDYSTIKFNPYYLKFYPSYVLFYTMNKYYLNDNNFRYVSDGARSLFHETNIQDFLIKKFRFRKAYCNLHIIYDYKIKVGIYLIYPLRLVFSFFNNRFVNKIKFILLQEKIRRSFL